MKKDENCIFCKLANGDIPTYSLYENEEFNVIFDAGPVTLGHALILPKCHAANIFEIDEELLGRAHILAKKIGTVLTEVFHADGLNILQNNHEAAGQSVFHFHIHVIPRYVTGPKTLSWTNAQASPEELEAVFNEITGD